MRGPKNVIGVMLSLAAVGWFILRAASTHEEMEPGPPPLHPSLWTVKTGWPLPLLAGEVHDGSAETLLWLEQIPKTKYTSVLWLDLPSISSQWSLSQSPFIRLLGT